MGKSADGEWMRPKDAVYRLSPFVGGDEAATRLIAGRLRDGALSARAEWMSVGADVGGVTNLRLKSTPIPGTDSGDGEGPNYSEEFLIVPEQSDTKIGSGYAYDVTKADGRIAELKMGFWNAGTNWADDEIRWDWNTGIFIITSPARIANSPENQHVDIKDRLPIRHVAYGVKFLKSEIEKITDSFRKTTDSPLQRKRRRSARKHDWEAILIELVAVAYYTGLDVEFKKNGFDDAGWQAALEVWISKKFEDDNLDCGEATVRGQAQQVVEAIAALRGGAR
jgi:hypothetical protein